MVRPESEDDDDVVLSLVEEDTSTSMLERQAAMSVGVSGTGGTRATTTAPSQSSTPAGRRKRTATIQQNGNAAKTARGKLLPHIWIH